MCVFSSSEESQERKSLTFPCHDSLLLQLANKLFCCWCCCVLKVFTGVSSSLSFRSGVAKLDNLIPTTLESDWRKKWLTFILNKKSYVSSFLKKSSVQRVFFEGLNLNNSNKQSTSEIRLGKKFSFLIRLLSVFDPIVAVPKVSFYHTPLGAVNIVPASTTLFLIACLVTWTPHFVWGVNIKMNPYKSQFGNPLD